MNANPVVMAFLFVAVSACSDQWSPKGQEDKDRKILNLTEATERLAARVIKSDEELATLNKFKGEREFAGSKLAEYLAALEGGNLDGAGAIFKYMTENYPDAPETKAIAFLHKTQLPAANLQANGSGHKIAIAPATDKKPFNIKAVKPVSSCKIDDVELSAIKISTSKKWIFDRNGYEYHYMEADKGSAYIIVTFTVKTKNKNPRLPTFVAAKLKDNESVQPFAIAKIKIPSWSSYGAYLGNYEDYSNDFSKRDSISFTSAMEVEDSDLKSQKIIVYASSGVCAQRVGSDGRPPFYYSMDDCEELAKKEIKISELANIVKVYN